MQFRMLKNKKAFFTDALTDAFAFIAVVLIIVIFSVALTIVKASGSFDIKGMEINMDAESVLLQILRTPVEVDGYKTDVAGHIIYADGNMSRIKDKLQPELETLLKNIVEKSSMNCLILQIDKCYVNNLQNRDTFEVKASEKKADACTYGDAVVELQIPGHNKIYTGKLYARNDKSS